MLHNLSQQLSQAQCEKLPLVQVRVLETNGSSYRKAGARMLINHLGQQLDLVSGGCLETHLGRHAIQLMDTGGTKFIDYDFSDPNGAAWQLAVGCRGQLKLLIEHLSPANQYAALDLYLQAQAAPHTSWMTTQLSTGQSQLHQRQPDPQPNQVIECITPAPKLLVIGAGPDALPLVKLARNLGYLVKVIDSRSQTLQRYNQPLPPADGATSVKAVDLNQLLLAQPHDFTLVMTHNLALDAEYLSQSGLQHMSYVGLLGPLDRKQRVVQSMNAPPPIHLHGPAGLDLGGHGAHAVALSIMAQIQMVRHGMKGATLMDKSTGIHDIE